MSHKILRVTANEQLIIGPHQYLLITHAKQHIPEIDMSPFSWFLHLGLDLADEELWATSKKYRCSSLLFNKCVGANEVSDCDAIHWKYMENNVLIVLFVLRLDSNFCQVFSHSWNDVLESKNFSWLKIFDVIRWDVHFSNAVTHELEAAFYSSVEPVINYPDLLWTLLEHGHVSFYASYR